MVDASAGQAKDYVISTGRTETVRKFVELSANKLGWKQAERELYGKEKVLMRLAKELIVAK